MHALSLTDPIPHCTKAFVCRQQVLYVLQDAEIPGKSFNEHINFQPIFQWQDLASNFETYAYTYKNAANAHLRIFVQKFEEDTHQV